MCQARQLVIFHNTQKCNWRLFALRIVRFALPVITWCKSVQKAHSFWEIFPLNLVYSFNKLDDLIRNIAF